MPSESESWSEGYVSDTAYSDHFIAEIAPAHLNYIAALNGCDVIPLSDGFTYCELGCGPGQTINVLASANPSGQFYACDFNPTHVVEARKLSKAGAIANVTVLERSFEEMAAEDLPDFDFITLHGIWSWVSAENRRRIVEFIYRKLKPGGLVYVSYNAYPGWTAVAPLQQMMRTVAQDIGGGSLGKVPTTVAFLKRLRDVHAQYFVANPEAGPFLAHLGGQEPTYLAHEYLNQNWTPFYSNDVAKELGVAKLKFVGSATSIENHHVLLMPKEMAAFLDTLPSREIAELAKDFMINQRFRRDVFVRGTPSPSAPKLRDIVFGLLRPAGDIVFKLRGPLAEYSFDGEAVRATAAALGEGAQTLRSLAARGDLSRYKESQLNQAAMVLIASSQAMAFAAEGRRGRIAQSGPLRVPLAFNRTVLDSSFTAPHRATLASPVTGNGLKVDIPSRLFLKRMMEGQFDGVPVAVWDQLEKNGIALTRDGRKVEGRAASVRDLERRLDHFKEKTLPSLYYMGVVEAA